MNKSTSAKLLIRQGWLRGLLYIIAILIATVIFVAVYMASVAGGNLQAALRGTLNPQFVQLLPFIPVLLVTFVFRRWVDRKPFISLGLNIQGHGKLAIAGGALAVFLICATALILKMTDHLKWVDIIFDPRALFMSMGSVLLVATYTELVFRGYLLNNLMDSFPNWLAILISALLFVIYNWSNINFHFDFFVLINSLIFGLLLGLYYIYTKNLWFPICFHFGWKFFLGPVLGVSESEYFQTLLETERTGDKNITGGIFGLEGSFILTGISLLALLMLYLYFQRKLSPQSQPVPGRI
jgi:membrane protease YdiL (CAAX protease family)